MVGWIYAPVEGLNKLAYHVMVVGSNGMTVDNGNLENCCHESESEVKNMETSPTQAAGKSQRSNTHTPCPVTQATIIQQSH